jgi:hypothetical protein
MLSEDPTQLTREHRFLSDSTSGSSHQKHQDRFFFAFDFAQRAL